MVAMIDPGTMVFQYRNRTTGEMRLMSAAEATSLSDAEDWNRAGPVQQNNQPIELTGERALELGVASYVVESFDELKRLFGIDEDPPRVKPNWALQLVQALASPQIAWFLLMMGFIGVYIELKTPGVGIGGFVAAVAFILYFWSHFLDGSATWLEVILFLSGTLFLLIEVFVLPGFGIFGLGGGVLVVFALVMASQKFFIPKTEAQLDELRTSITVVAGAGVGMMFLAWALRHYLPQAPVFSRIMLEPPPSEDQHLRSEREALADYAHLTGVVGKATTDLLPAGKALIGDELIDVIAESEPIDRGAAVIVVDAQANRVVVRVAEQG